MKKAECNGRNRRIKGIRREAGNYFQILPTERGQFHCVQSGSKCHVLGHRETALKRKRPEQEKLLMLGTPGLRGPESSHTKAQEGLGPGGFYFSLPPAKTSSWMMSRVMVLVRMA